MLAGVGTLFLAIEPFLISESRRAHTDVLTALFLFLSLLLWLCYLEGETRKPRRDLVLSGLCFGLACLTKSHAGAFVLFLPIMLTWYHYQCRIQWTKLLLSALLWITATLLTVGVAWPYLWTVRFGNLALSPLLFIGSGTLLVWSWKKFSQETHFTFSKTVFFLIGTCVLVLGVPTLFAAKIVIAKMYSALTNTHPAPTPFLGVSRYNPGPLFYPVMWFVWTGLLTLPLILFTIYRSWQMRQKEKKDISHCYRDVYSCSILLYRVELCCPKNIPIYYHYPARSEPFSSYGGGSVCTSLEKEMARLSLSLPSF